MEQRPTLRDVWRYHVITTRRTVKLLWQNKSLRSLLGGSMLLLLGTLVAGYFKGSSQWTIAEFSVNAWTAVGMVSLGVALVLSFAAMVAPTKIYLEQLASAQKAENRHAVAARSAASKERAIREEAASA